MFENEVNSGERTMEIMEGLRRFMLLNNTRWDEMIKKFELTRKGEISLNDFVEGLFSMDLVDSGNGLEIVF